MCIRFKATAPEVKQDEYTCYKIYSVYQSRKELRSPYYPGMSGGCIHSHGYYGAFVKNTVYARAPLTTGIYESYASVAFPFEKPEHQVGLVFDMGGFHCCCTKEGVEKYFDTTADYIRKYKFGAKVAIVPVIVKHEDIVAYGLTLTGGDKIPTIVAKKIRITEESFEAAFK